MELVAINDIMRGPRITPVIPLRPSQPESLEVEVVDAGPSAGGVVAESEIVSFELLTKFECFADGAAG